jgi:hypothetical protein
MRIVPVSGAAGCWALLAGGGHARTQRSCQAPPTAAHSLDHSFLVEVFWSRGLAVRRYDYAAAYAGARDVAIRAQ